MSDFTHIRDFEKDHPLSPNSKAIEIDGALYLVSKNGRKRRVAGVHCRNSLYYWWIEYLRRSDLYRELCDSNGAANNHPLKEIYEDFGNVFLLATASDGFLDEHDFYKEWWEKRGVRIFGVQRLKSFEEFVSFDDLLKMEDEIRSGKIKLIAFTDEQPKVEQRKRANKLIGDLEIKGFSYKNSLRYRFADGPLNVASLRECLEVYDMVVGQEMSNVEAYLRWVYKDEKVLHEQLRYYLADGRDSKNKIDRWRLRTDEEMVDLFGIGYESTDDWRIKEAEAASYAEKMMENASEKRKRVKGAAFGLRTRALTVDEEDRLQAFYFNKKLGLLVRHDESVTREKEKSKYASIVSRMVRKAKANITAVEKGTFGVSFRKLPPS